jgi:hypothetical protein
MAEIPLRQKRFPRVPKTPNGEPTAPVTTIQNTEVLPNTVALEPAPQPVQEPQAPKEPTLNDLYRDFWLLLNGENPLSKNKEMSALVSKIIQKVMSPYETAAKYNWIIIHDSTKMLRNDADKIYKTTTAFDQKKEVGLIITSGGGEIEPAYLISKLCRESTTGMYGQPSADCVFYKKSK